MSEQTKGSPKSQDELRPGGGDSVWPVRLLWTLGLLLGCAYLVILPPFQAPDEFAHFYRAYSISEGTCVAPRVIAIPQALEKLAADFPPHLEQERRITHSGLTQLAATYRDNGVTAYASNHALNVYHCVPYLPSALAIRVGRIFTLSPPVLLYMSRFCNMLAYLSLVALTLRILPGFHLLFLAIALTPMALHQAASASWDGFSFASAFLLLAMAIHHSFPQSSAKITPRDLALFGLVCVLASFSRLNVWLSCLVLLIPAARFSSRRAQWTAIAAIGAAVSLAFVGWQIINRENYELYLQSRIDRQGIYFQDNLRYVREHPFLVIGAWWRTVCFHAYDYLSNFIGTLGWLAVTIPAPIVAAYTSLLLFLSVTQSGPIRFSSIQRLLLLAATACGIVFTFLALWAADTPRSYIQSAIAVGEGHIPGGQGRYFIPFALPFLLSISYPLIRVNRRALICITASVVLIANAAGVNGIERTYYKHDTSGPRKFTLAVYRGGALQVEDGETPTAGAAGEGTPVAGDWTGEGRTSFGIYRDGFWTLSSESTKLERQFGGSKEDVPVTGDWNGDGRTDIGIYRSGEWLLDSNGDGVWNQADRTFRFGGLPGDIPVTGDWTGDGKTKVGIYRRGLWILDRNGNGGVDTTGAQGDQIFALGGLPDDIPVTGDWTGSRKALAGIYRQGLWLLDLDGNRTTDKPGPYAERTQVFGGLPGDRPLPGRW